MCLDTVSGICPLNEELITLIPFDFWERKSSNFAFKNSSAAWEIGRIIKIFFKLWIIPTRTVIGRIGSVKSGASPSIGRLPSAATIIGP